MEHYGTILSFSVFYGFQELGSTCRNRLTGRKVYQRAGLYYMTWHIWALYGLLEFSGSIRGMGTSG